MIRWITTIDAEKEESVNIFVVVLLSIGFAISTTVNPFIIHYYCSKAGSAVREKLSGKLFLSVSCLDFMTNSYPLLHILYFCLCPSIDLGTTVHYQVPEDEAQVTQFTVPSVIFCTLGCTGQAATTVLAIVRLLSIYRPFISYPSWIPLSYIASFGVFTGISEALFASLHHMQADTTFGEIISYYDRLCAFCHIFLGVIGITASVMIALRIYSAKKKSGAEWKYSPKAWSSLLICLMNLPYLISVINYLLCNTVLEKYGYYYLSFVTVTCFTSMLNPVLVVLMNGEIRQSIRSVWKCNNRVTGSTGSVQKSLSSGQVGDQSQPSQGSIHQSEPSLGSLDQSEPSLEL